jgi:hypothetical protein
MCLSRISNGPVVAPIHAGEQGALAAKAMVDDAIQAHVQTSNSFDAPVSST